MTIVAPINRTERIWGAGLHRREAGFILGRATRWADGGCARSLGWSSSKMARHRLPPPALTSPRKPHLQLPCYFGIDHLVCSERPHTAKAHSFAPRLARRPLQRPGAKRLRPGVHAGVGRYSTPPEGRSRSFSNSGFSQRRPGAWLKPVCEKPAKAGSHTHLPAYPALKDRSTTLRARPLKRSPRGLSFTKVENLTSFVNFLSTKVL